MRIALLVTALSFFTAPAQSQEVGAKLIDPANAGAIFAEACIKKLPSFRRSGNTLDVNGFLKASTGTFFHPEFNISVKPVRNEKCSLVMVFRGDDAASISRFSDAVTKRTGGGAAGIKITTRQLAGKNYLVAETRPE